MILVNTKCYEHACSYVLKVFLIFFKLIFYDFGLFWCADIKNKF